MSVIVSLCVIRIEICEDRLDPRLQEEIAMSSQKKPAPNRGRRQVKEINIETYSSSDTTENKSLLKSERLKEGSKCQETVSAGSQNPSTEGQDEKKNNVITFVSGSPFVEVTKGILHLYKENKLTNIDHESFHSQIVCILAVPATMTCRDLLVFTAACHNNIQHIRIIRDGTVNQYMALLYFRTKDAAAMFHEHWSGVPFNSLETAVCQLVFVSQVEILNEDEGAWNAPLGHTELPTCPVCLERMDESVMGILTILCNHTFHSNCLSKWGDTSCPVCRYVQTPEVVAENKCFECHSSEKLWICLVCGHVGCGRYKGGHAQKHYIDTSHCFSMQLGNNNRVWDYAGDNFVHRLLQNKTDGKLVEGPSPEKHYSGQPADMDEKLDSVQLEYTYLLTSQLETQRAYYEEKISRLQDESKHGSVGIQESVDRVKAEKSDLEAEVSQLNREKTFLDKKVHQLSLKLNQTQSELNDEKQLSKALQMNQVTWQNKFIALEKDFKEYQHNKELELTELKEQLRDVMFYFEAQKKISECSEREEIAEGTIVIAETPTTSSKIKRRSKKR